ncbi:MAG: DUF6519 domain-containing protein [Rubrivivax sp.]
MKTQISRASDRPERRYSGVYQQQGRMITDADWNELVEILKRRLDDTLADVVGSGMPRGRPLRLAEAGGQPVIVPGEVYADGLHGRVAGDAPLALTAQVDFPGARPIPAGTDAWVYADLWERSVDALEDGALRDPGLHGADTTTRTQTMVQVKWWPVGAEPADPCANPRIGDATVQVRLPDASSAAVDEDGCVAVDGSSVRIGNYLFRVEVHEVEPLAEGAVKLTLKWSGENGAEQCAVAAEGGAAPDLANVPEEFLAGPWSWELCDDAGEKRLGVHPREARPAARPLLSRTPQQTDLDPTVQALRRWDGHARFTVSRQGAVTSAVDGQDHGQTFGAASGPGHAEATSGPGGRRGLRLTLAQLEFEIRLDGRSFLSGDHWLAVVRENAVDAARVTVLNDGAALGVRHHYLLLGEWRGGRLVPPASGSEAERRRSFPPLSALEADRIGYDPSATRDRWLDIDERPMLAPRWARRIGAAGDDTVRALGADGEGNIVVAGAFEGALDAAGVTAVGAGTSSRGVYLAKLAADGSVRWVKAFAAGAGSQAQSIALHAQSGRIALAGSFVGSIDFGAGHSLAGAGGRHAFIACFGADGSCRWAQNFGGSSQDIGYAVAVDPTGHALLAGCFTDRIRFGTTELPGSGRLDAFVARFGLDDGSFVWARSFGAAGYDVGHAIACDSAGNVFVSGFFQGSMVVGDGHPPLTSGGKSDVFVLKLDAQGRTLWAAGYGGTASDYGRAIAVDREGHLLVTGAFQGQLRFGATVAPLVAGGGYDIYLARLSGADGSALWSKSFPAASAQQGRAIAADAAGRVLLAGEFSGRLDLGGGVLVAEHDSDAFVALFDGDGQHLYSLRCGGGGAELGRAVAALPGGGIALGGSFVGSATIGGVALAGRGGREAFVLALGPATGGPITVQQAIDQLAGGLESSDIDYVLPGCGPGIGSTTVQRRLAEKAGWSATQRVKLDALLDALLCQLDATAVPAALAGQPTTAQAALDRLWSEKVAKAGDTMTGPLAVQADVHVRDRLGVGTATPGARVAIDGGLHVGGDSDPGNDNLQVDGSMLFERSASSAAAIRVLRGAGKPDAQLVWDEPSQRWKATSGGQLVDIAYATNLDALTNGSVADSLHRHSHLYAAATGGAALSIDANGRVGIGTGTPDALLQIAAAPQQSISDGAARIASRSGLFGRLYSWGGDGFFVGISDEGASGKDAVLAWNSGSGVSLRFLSVPPSGGTRECLRVDQDGVVSIGGSARQTYAVLQVEGTVNATGQVFFDQTLADVSQMTNVATASTVAVAFGNLGAQVDVPQRTRVRVTVDVMPGIVILMPQTGDRWVSFYAQTADANRVLLWQGKFSNPTNQAPGYPLAPPRPMMADLWLPEGVSQVRVMWAVDSGVQAVVQGSCGLRVEL